jgi:hypothetical protein
MAQRFWAKVAIRGTWDCWEWQANRKPEGYGQFKATPGTSVRASRMAWELTYGKPGALWVLHHCDNPPCCNPRHLSLGTPADNTLDCLRKGRFQSGDTAAALTAFVERIRRLTDAQITEARQRHAAGESSRSIGRALGVHHTTILRLVNGTHWANA